MQVVRSKPQMLGVEFVLSSASMKLGHCYLMVVALIVMRDFFLGQEWANRRKQQSRSSVP
jgi:hypothetical protein